MVVKQIGEPDKQIEARVRNVLTEQTRRNSDGFFFKNGSDVQRTLNKSSATTAIQTAQLNNLMVHFRMASAGKVSEKNVHGWEIGDWTFFHNGGSSSYVPDYSKSQTMESTDSFLFFQDLWLMLEQRRNDKDKVIAHIIKNLLSRTAFWGRAALYNSKTDKMFLFGDFQSYILGGKYLILSSCEVDFEEECNFNIQGIKFKYPSSFFIGKSKLEGIGVIGQFSTPAFHYRQLIEKFETQTRTYNQPWSDPTMEWDKKSGTYQKKLPPGLPKIILPSDRSLTPEQQAIADNLDNIREEFDFNPSEVVEAYTEADRQRLYDDPEFVGWNEAGIEMYKDKNAIHDDYSQCCHSGTCLGLADTAGLILKEEVIKV